MTDPRFAVVVALGSLALLGACGAPPGDGEWCEVESPLVDHTRWVSTLPDEDPWLPPAEGEATPCQAPLQMFVEPFGELTSFTVETEACNWATVEQTLAQDLTPEHSLHARIWYFSQTRFDGTEAVLAFSVEDRPLAEWRVPIPADGGQVSEVFAPGPAAAGERVRFHVGNHGSNTWNLLELNVVKRVRCDAVDDDV